MTEITIALDAMGGDAGLALVIPSAIKCLKKHDDLHLLLVGDTAVIEQHLKDHNLTLPERMTIHHASEVVEMCEAPSRALRNKKDSSMRVAIDLVKEKKAQGIVSAGNTGALMATARFVLKMLPGVDRPAIISEMPCINSKVRLLDLGANIDSCAENLFQFAVMGSVLVAAEDNIENPTVGLLNIGVEEIKGNDQVKRTSQLLSESNIVNYVGYVEGDDIYTGTTDVIVCDGFVGNVVLKSSEGLANLMGQCISEAFTNSFYSRMTGMFANSLINDVRKRFNPALYNGASFLGLNGTVIKSHGSTSELGFCSAIEKAIVDVRMDVPKLIGEKLADILL